MCSRLPSRPCYHAFISKRRDDVTKDEAPVGDQADSAGMQGMVGVQGMAGMFTAGGKFQAFVKCA